jgi:uncharacterized integral membrane protein
MYLRTLLIIFMLAILAVFATLNWSVFTAPTPLSLGFSTIEAPLGLILLAMFAVLVMLFLVYVVYLQSSVMFEGRRHARELQTQRELADQAEVSRFSQLRSFLEGELRKLGDQNEESKASFAARMAQLDRDLHAVIESSENSLAASIGELDDRVERLAAASSTRRPS